MSDFYDDYLSMDEAAPWKGESGGWSEWKNRQNQSAPNLIFSPAGFERMTGGGEGVASVLYPRLCVYVHIFMPVI